MDLQELIKRLTAIKGVTLAETREGDDGRRTYIFTATLPEFPFGKGKNSWYPLVLPKGQDSISRNEVEAILRHLWHGEQNFFEVTADAAKG
jgi:hypothetical protein